MHLRKIERSRRESFAGGVGREGLLAGLLIVAVAFTASFDAAPTPAAPQTEAQFTPAAAEVHAPPPSSVRVIDGDTIDLDGERIRFFGVDAPEGRQSCGAEHPGPQATHALQQLIGAAEVRCEGVDRDRYGRRVASCVAGGVDLSAAMVRAGWAWNYTRYAGDRYADEEREARENRRGVWAMACEAPWVWRRRGSPGESRADSPETTPSDSPAR